MIPFNVPPVSGDEILYLEEAVRAGKICGDGSFTRRCHEWFERTLPARKVLLTTSCTHALEMTAMLLDVKEGDEVIMPSYTFVSTASAFALRGARVIFVDISPETMNIDPSCVKAALTERTRAIVVVHYAGVACEMDSLQKIADAAGVPIVEDAAQGFMARYKGRMLGTIGTFGCFSFHETKNISCGEGGLLVLNDQNYSRRAEILREKGTNRIDYIQGKVDKYTWVDLGSSYLPSELNAAYLCAQLDNVPRMQADRMKTWNRYMDSFRGLEDAGKIDLPRIPAGCEHDAHMFYVKARDAEQKAGLAARLAERGIQTATHYVPLHTSPQGKLCGEFRGSDVWTTRESERLLRLPLWFGIPEKDVNQVVNAVRGFFTE